MVYEYILIVLWDELKKIKIRAAISNVSEFICPILIELCRDIKSNSKLNDLKKKFETVLCNCTF